MDDETTERPCCAGKWTDGSGGHRVHERCGKLADWWHPDDMYAYCDEHAPPLDIARGDYVRWDGDLLLQEALIERAKRDAANTADYLAGMWPDP